MRVLVIILVMLLLIDCSPPDSSVYGIFQARILERIAISFSRGSSQPTGGIWVSCIAGEFFITESHREALVILEAHH